MESIDGFWKLVLDVWQNGAFGIDVGRVIISLGIFAAFIVFRGLFERFVIANIKHLATKTENDFDDRLAEALAGPLRLLPIVAGVFFSLDYLSLDESFVAFTANLVRSLIAFNIFWALYRIIRPLQMVFDRLNELLGESMVEWLIRALRGVIAFIGGATILELWGIQVGPLLAGLGLFGVAVALGAQDLFKNLIAGVMILVEKRFQKGDWILVDGVVEGTVEHIGFRSTHVRRFDKAPVYVPNSEMSNIAVTNFSEMTHRRIYWKIGLVYSTSIEQLRTIRDELEAYIIGNEDYAQPPEVSTFVRVDSFNDSSIDIMLYCFTRTTQWGQWLAIKEELAYRVMDIVESAGSSFAFPSQSLYVESLPSDRPEVFVPPTGKSD